VKNDYQGQEISWEACGYHVIKEIDRISQCTSDIKKDVTAIKTKDIGNIRDEISALKVKATAWGAIGGAVPFLLALGVWLLK
jgi:hypothetical protein